MYQFKPSTATGSKKLVMIAWVIALLLIPIFYLTVTGKTTVDEKNQELDQRLNVALEQNNLYLGDLKTCASGLDSCSNELNATKENLTSALVSKEAELAGVNKQLSEINANISYYENLLSQANASVSQCESTFKAVVVNSAKDICCRPGLETANFGLVNYRIMCNGNYTINCTNGESDY